MASVQPITQTSESKIFHRFTELLELHFVEYAYADLFADVLNINQKKLNHIARQFTGKTACQLVEEKIVSETIKLLITTTTQIHVIAAKLGYEDQYYFSRMFKRHTGHSPRHYRNLTSKMEK